jgi:hypothetical protein
MLTSATHFTAHAAEEFDGDTWIGRDTADDDRYFRGEIDDVRIYNYALDASAVELVRAGGRAENPSPFDSQADAPQRATLTWSAGATAVGHDVYFGTDYAAVANATTESSEYKGRVGENSYVPFLSQNTEYFWRIDEARSALAPITGNVWKFTTGSSAGTITREVWTDISGSSVTSLTGSRDYPASPSMTNEITVFEGPVDWADHYGTRIHGFLIPPGRGSYIFWIAGDDNCELWLSTDANPLNRVRIAHVPGWTDHREWDKYSEQQSDRIVLVGGRAYYIMALHKEHEGGDNIAVAWQGPGFTQRVISGRYLAPYDVDLPTPNPMVWVTPPHPTGAKSISMTAATALDRSQVEYYFTCTSPGGHDSDWQNSPIYEDRGLNPNTAYTYTVTARDKSQNQNATAPSTPQSARTWMRGDLQGDGGVDLRDYAEIAQCFCDGCDHTETCQRADFDNDGNVDLRDLSILLEDWLVIQP